MAKNEFDLEYQHHYHHNHEEYDEEDALSLCDLAMDGSYCEDEEENYSIKGRSSCDHQDLEFEFSSGELNFGSFSSISSSNSIIFCGKLIANKQPETTIHKPSKKTLTNNNIGFPWRNSRSSNILLSRPDFKPSSLSNQDKRYNKTQSMPKYGFNNNNKNQIYSVKNVSIMPTPIKSSRWYLSAFGRSPAKMELRDSRTQNLTTTITISSWSKKENMVKKVGSSFRGMLKILRFKKKKTYQ